MSEDFDDVLTRIILTVKDDDNNYHSSPMIGHGLGSMMKNGSFMSRIGVKDGEMVRHMIFECVNIEDEMMRHDSLDEYVEYLEDKFNQEARVHQLPARSVRGYED